MRLLFVFAILFVSLSGSLIKAQSLSFFKEDISFHLDTNRFTVEGFYFFSNNDSMPVSRLIFFPLPDDDNLGEVDTIFVYDETMKMPLDFIKPKTQGIYFNLAVEKYGFRKIKIYYEQKLKSNFAQYILTTTQHWSRPLITASYTLQISNKIQIDSISYNPDDVIMTDSITMYRWNMENFMPDKDFLIYFNRANEK